MHSGTAHHNLSCVSCHRAHDFDLQWAAVDACLQCHNDAHSTAFRRSPHFKLWEAEIEGRAPAGTGVSCATCHLPRIRNEAGEVLVQHNQNDNLRPNEKMIRSVCVNCHGVPFSLEALADAGAIERCFDQAPDEVHQTILWVRARAREIEQRRIERERKKKKGGSSSSRQQRQMMEENL
ncbi:MAG: ammonia-forming cytochrome c nitrite reductase subunit c552, partial [Verrucomicrobiota bacterium]